VNGDEFDRAIDAAVRAILDAEPPAGLRQRVLRQLTGGDTRVWFTVPRVVAVAVAVLCVLAAGFVTLTMNRTRTGPSTQVATTAPPTRPSEPSTPVATPGRPADSSLVAHQHRTSRGTGIGGGPSGPTERIVAATSIEENESTVSISALDPLREIEQSPIRSEVVQMDEIAIAPLDQLQPVRIEPLSPTPR
jgi:hypothetical protein